jgi:crotonobetainyl-CoA:carnitine CoA-transferase CaiB-like acyl-CoA transferase
VSLTPFGADGGYRDFRGGDLVATHMSGVGWETPWHQVTDLANQPPLRIAGRQTDYLAGYTAAAAAMIALIHRKSTGAGQHVDVSQWLSMVSMMRPAIGVYGHESKESPAYERTRARLKHGAAWVYPCKDGWVSFSATTERFWKGWKEVLGHPEWMEAEMFATTASRVQHIDAIEAMLHDWLSTHTRDEAFRKGQANHVPCFPVHTVREVAENPQYAARGYFVDHDHGAARETRMPGAPCRFSATPWRIKRGAPRLGEHNRAIFGGRLGVGDEQLAELAAAGII